MNMLSNTVKTDWNCFLPIHLIQYAIASCTFSSSNSRKCSAHLPFPSLESTSKPGPPKVFTCSLQPNIGPGISREDASEVGTGISSWSRHIGLRELLPAILQADCRSKTQRDNLQVRTCCHLTVSWINSFPEPPTFQSSSSLGTFENDSEKKQTGRHPAASRN